MGTHTRREFLKRLAVAAGSLAVSRAAFAGEQSKRKPNVVLIFTDDQGTLDVNCYGSKDLFTPNLDRLAGQGTRFTQFYVGAPVCSPSRSALMTGRYPQRAGVPSNVSSQKGNAGMPTEQVTIAEMLKGAGYVTGHVGKWHLGYTPETMPNGQGFDYSFGHMGGCIDNYSHFFYWQGPNRHDLWRNGVEVWHEGEFFPGMVAAESCRFIEENKDHPFFLYTAFNVPHYPMQGTEKYRKMYEHLEEPRRAYAEFVSTLDENIGKIIDRIDRLGIRKNTLIIFCSDNGHSVEERANFGGGNTGPFRGHKFTLWEGGIRMPCIVSWPGRIPQNAVRDQIVASIDWFATIAHYCQVRVHEPRIDGRNISSVIEGAAAPSPHEVLHWQTGRHWAVREGHWKLVHNGPATDYKGRKIASVPDFLSNMSEDVTETRNLAEDHPDIVARLTSLHEQWLKDVRQQ
jgi:arylsulfatase A